MEVVIKGCLLKVIIQEEVKGGSYSDKSCFCKSKLRTSSEALQIRQIIQPDSAYKFPLSECFSTYRGKRVRAEYLTSIWIF